MNTSEIGKQELDNNFGYKNLSRGVKSKATKLLYSLSDQVFTVGATFAANVLLARVDTHAGYGTFVLIYSIFTFLSGIHNALVLEPYTVFAAGKYRNVFSDYLQLFMRINAVIGAGLALLVLIVAGVLYFWWPEWFSITLLGLAAAVLFVFTGALARRTFYVNFDARLAAFMSMAFFATVSIGLTILYYQQKVNGFSVFLVLAMGWLVASPVFFFKYPIRSGARRFISSHHRYWSGHWNYARWVLATALVFQLLGQGYLWITGILLSVEDVASLKAVQNIVSPVNLIFSSISLLILPRMAHTFQQQSIAGLTPIVRRLLVAVLGASALFILFIYAAGNPILNLVYAGKYNTALPLLYIIALTPAALGLGNVFNDTLKAMEHPKSVFYAYLGGGLTTILAGVPLILAFGLTGAAWGMVLSSLVYGVVLMNSYHKFVRTVGTIPAC
jgi:O-antigen/teichoic acid export membrane protein